MHIKITSAVLIDGKIVRNGHTAVVDASTGRRLVQRGKAIVVSHDDPAPQDNDLDAMTLAALRDMAEREGCDVPKGARKGDLIALLRRLPGSE